MPNYLVRVTHTYPVCSVDPKDALSTVPMVIKLRYIGCHAEGLTEILDPLTKKVLLTAKLVQGPMPADISQDKVEAAPAH